MWYFSLEMDEDRNSDVGGSVSNHHPRTRTISSPVPSPVTARPLSPGKLTHQALCAEIVVGYMKLFFSDTPCCFFLCKISQQMRK